MYVSPRLHVVLWLCVRVGAIPIKKVSGAASSVRRSTISGSNRSHSPTASTNKPESWGTTNYETTSCNTHTLFQKRQCTIVPVFCFLSGFHQWQLWWKALDVVTWLTWKYLTMWKTHSISTSFVLMSHVQKPSSLWLTNHLSTSNVSVWVSILCNNPISFGHRLRQKVGAQVWCGWWVCLNTETSLLPGH